jgi:hypothetical protein
MRSNHQSQISVQRVDATAAALGNRATAINNIRQFSRQRQRGINATPQSQIAGQQVNANTAATGESSTAISGLEQHNSQNQFDF